MRSNTITAIDVAAYLLDELGGMSAMRLQKLVYYTQAWHLIRHEKPMFIENIEAWSYGPIVRELYEIHKRKFVIRREDIDDKGDGSRIRQDSDAENTIKYVTNVYGQKDGVELNELVHQEEAYIQARQHAVIDGRSNVFISHHLMETLTHHPHPSSL